MRKTAAEFTIGIIYLAILYALVRPSSPAAPVVAAVSSALVAVIGSATGYNQTGSVTNG